MKVYRVKTYIYVQTDNEQAAEAVVAKFVEESDVNPDIPFEIKMRKGSAKLMRHEQLLEQL